VGPEIKVTPRDVVTANFQRMEMEFESGPQQFGFETKGGLVGWKRGLTQQFSASGSFGLSILTPGNSLQYLANAELQWKGKRSTATLSYSRTVFPSFFIAAAPLLSQNIGISGTHKLTDALNLTASANYALNETISGSTVKFESWAVIVGMAYTISRTMIASVSYNHSEYSYVLTGQDFGFDRDVLMASIRKEWR
jgi:uncharacterized protein (PEP-CTERM system associated)